MKHNVFQKITAAVLSALMLLTAASCAGGNAGTNDTSEKEETQMTQETPQNALEGFESSAKLVLPHEAKGTVTYVIDDTHKEVAMIAEDLAEKYPSLKITFAIIVSFLVSVQKSGGNYAYNEDGTFSFKGSNLKYGYWDKLLKSYDGKRFSFDSHTYSHAPWGIDDTTDYGFPANTIQLETLGSKQAIKQFFGVEPLAMIEPGTGNKLNYRPYFLEQVKKHYYGMRTTNKDAKNTPDYFAANVNNRYNIGSFMIVDRTDGVPTPGLVDSWKSYIDSKLRIGGWACFCIHHIRHDGSGLANQQVIYESQADELFGYTESLGDDVWVALFDDAMKYYFEMSTADLKVENDGEKLTVKITDGEPDEVFDFPLWVNVQVPEEWTEAYADGEVLEIKEKNGRHYVLVEVAPDTDGVSVTGK
ncbi:MAG: hypothetical protein KBT31_00275 [Firmicutes bacterium]|nr:hypothetical protein [Candidatus Colimorpha enterica]